MDSGEHKKQKNFTSMNCNSDESEPTPTGTALRTVPLNCICIWVPLMAWYTVSHSY
jgi:hypothetical protein